MNRAITLGITLLLVNLSVHADAPASDLDLELELDAEQTLEIMTASGLGLNGPSLADYRRCNRDCKTLWSDEMEPERLECVRGCRSVRSHAIFSSHEPPNELLH